MPSALVTGGSSGIGLAIARMLGRGGLRADARRAHARAARGCRSRARRAVAVAADVSSEDDCVSLVAEHVERHGGLDVLVNSAGVGIAGQIGDTSTKHFDLQLGVNLRGTFLVTREALPHLRPRRASSSTSPRSPARSRPPGLATYGAAKAAVIALTRSLDREEAESGVRVTALCPGFVDTPMAAWTGLPARR